MMLEVAAKHASSTPQVASEIRDLAVRLLAYEATVKSLPGPNMQVAMDVLEALF